MKFEKRVFLVDSVLRDEVHQVLNIDVDQHIDCVFVYVEIPSEENVHERMKTLRQKYEMFSRCIRDKETLFVFNANGMTNLVPHGSISVATQVYHKGVLVQGVVGDWDDSYVFIKKEWLIRNIISGQSSKNEELMNETMAFLRHLVEVKGWFYPPEQDFSSLEKSLDGLKSKSSVLTNSNDGSKWLKGIVKSFWNVDAGPAKSFNNDKILKSVLAYRFGLNNSKPYQYKLENGQVVTCNEVFDINFKNIRTGFIVQRNKVSWFRPSWASYIYNRYCKDIENPTVWDPSIGFSARLLGFSALFDCGSYIGTDPSMHMITDARRVSLEISRAKPDITCQLYNCGSEKYIPDVDSLDFVFTSPPYFDVEKYFDETGQCWRDYSTLEDWKRGYLVPTFQNARRGLKDGRSMVINIFPHLRGVVLECAALAGFECVDEIKMSLSADHFARGVGSDLTKYELFLVFK